MQLVGLWDTAGNEEYDRLRPLSYPRTEASVLCYNPVCNPRSFESIRCRRVEEIQHHPVLAFLRFILLALQRDARDDESTDRLPSLRKEWKRFLSSEQGVALVTERGSEPKAFLESERIQLTSEVNGEWREALFLQRWKLEAGA